VKTNQSYDQRSRDKRERGQKKNRGRETKRERKKDKEKTRERVLFCIDKGLFI